jgi:methanogenic corrinoid protein MtbC1
MMQSRATDNLIVLAQGRDAGGMLRDVIDGRLQARDRIGAVDAALAAVSTGEISIDDLYRTLAEILVDTGAAWQGGTTEVWEEHLTTSVVRNIVEACAPLIRKSAHPPIGRTVVLCTPPNEYHDLGIRMLADRFVLAGWTAHLLGADLPVTELSSAVDELGAEAVAVSVSTHFNRLTLRSYVDALAEAQPDVAIWVGGPAFAHDHEDWPEAVDFSSLPDVEGT